MRTRPSRKRTSPIPPGPAQPDAPRCAKRFVTISALRSEAVRASMPVRRVLTGTEIAPTSSMATRSEQFRANEQRKHAKNAKPVRAAAARRPQTDETSQRTEHARKKATHALEITAAGKRPTRKSTRGSANRAKPDTTFNLVESLVKGSPEARFRKANARSLRIRGSARATK